MTVDATAMVTLEEYDRVRGALERKVELVEGVLAVVPFDRFGNRLALSRLAATLHAVLPADLWVLTDAALTLVEEAPSTVRIPDLIVVRADIDPDAWRPAPGSAVLAVEVVSPSSVSTDYVRKRREYAQAGIPTYLVVDPDRRVLTVLDDPADGDYRRETLGPKLTLTVDGWTVPLSVDDLLA